MLRAVSTICFESQALELVAGARHTRRDVFKLFRTYATSSSPGGQRPRKLKRYRTTVLTSDGVKAAAAAGESGTASAPPPPAEAPPPPPSQPPRTPWTIAAAAAAISASLGGVYLFSKRGEGSRSAPTSESKSEAEEDREPEPSALPSRVQYLLVGGGTAAFAAMRAIRSARPEASVLLVSDEHAPPYMRPPLSKEVWREPELAERAAAPAALTFRQWNGRRRPVLYEPAAFYLPPERLEEGGGAAVAGGWRVTRLDVARHEAVLEAAGRAPASLRWERCLVATGVRPRRVPALAPAAAAGRSLTLRTVRDVQRLAAALDRSRVRTVLVLGGGFLASELSASLADRLKDTGKEVVQVFREEAAMAHVLPQYLAEETSRRLAAAGVTLRSSAEVVESAMTGEGRVRLLLASGQALEADVVVECVGSEVDEELARASGLETDPALGGLVVNAELQARSDVYAAGDVACFYDVALGRRRVEHHDHAVVSGRLAGENMAAVAPPKHYQHQSMFWSDLGPDLGYEAIGIIDSRLPTVGVFAEDAVRDEAAAAVSVAAGEEAAAAVTATAGGEAAVTGTATQQGTRRYERGVVFYLRERRVVGVLLWNMFNRMHVARQVLAQGEFDDLFEVAKLFSPQDEN